MTNSQSKLRILETSPMDPRTQTEMLEAAERNVLTYLAALGYDQKPRQLILERGLTFTPLPPNIIKEGDPAANSWSINIDFDNKDPSLLNANVLTPVAGNNDSIGVIWVP